jgi:putative transposase
VPKLKKKGSIKFHSFDFEKKNKSMLPITKITSVLTGILSKTKIKHLNGFIAGILCVRYEVTTRGIARYNSYSLRSMFRFLKQEIDWEMIRIALFKAFVFSEDKHFIATADETVEGKSRNKSHGIGTFYSSTAKKPINGICFFGLTLTDVTKRCSYAISVKQVIFTPEDKERNAEKKAKIKATKARVAKGESLPKGRNKGTKNKPKEENNTASYRTFKEMWNRSMTLIFKQIPSIKISHLVADSAYGTHDYLSLAKIYNCFLISKMSSNAALYAPYLGEQNKKGRRRIYGKKMDLGNLDDTFLKKTEENLSHEQKTYQFKAYSKSIVGIALNVVLIVTTRKSDAKKSINVWFTNDLDLSFEILLDYYSLRFQIEFEFRDAKQHFGLSDFKNYKKENLTNFVNLSFLMCLISKILLESYRETLKNDRLSVLDLKILFNTRHTAKSIFKLTRNNPEVIFNEAFCDQFLSQELINVA